MILERVEKYLLFSIPLLLPLFQRLIFLNLLKSLGQSLCVNLFIRLSVRLSLCTSRRYLVDIYLGNSLVFFLGDKFILLWGLFGRVSILFIVKD